jgi:2-polyprenyl-3-methyl-5-hydroxy-6-metoxy-1,4-benzoquinol methylase
MRQYDGIMTNDFLEHVQDPEAFFKECANLLVPSGKMAHSTGCYDYVYEFSPFHLFFFCGESVQRLIARTGFRLLAEHRDEHPDCLYICRVFERVEPAAAPI